MKARTRQESWAHSGQEGMTSALGSVSTASVGQRPPSILCALAPHWDLGFPLLPPTAAMGSVIDPHILLAPETLAQPRPDTPPPDLSAQGRRDTEGRDTGQHEACFG